ncbi:MAG: hypothetical protein HC923_06090 [Myxococcales bacterium]|nr:hypothetical protein [Myxococcales bacterium]
MVSARGRRLALAIDEASISLKTRDYLKLLLRIVRSLLDAAEPDDLRRDLDRFDEAVAGRQLRLRKYLDELTRPHPDVLLLDADRVIERADKKFLLREMEERATVAVINERGHLTAATFHDEAPYGIDLRKVPGLRGQRGFAWGRTTIDGLIRALDADLRRRRARSADLG